MDRKKGKRENKRNRRKETEKGGKIRKEMWRKRRNNMREKGKKEERE